MDHRRAEELVHEIGSEIVRGSKFAARPWRTIVVVAEIGESRRLFGCCFWDDGWEAATQDGFGALLMFEELREVMASGDAPRGKALCRISRPDRDIEIEFDAVGDRWTLNPADPEGFARSLLARPSGH